MRVISRRRLLEFAKKNADAYTPLDNWYRAALGAEWKSLNDVRQVFPSADIVGNFTIFNIKGNNYRLIVSIDYERQLLYVKYILTHADYDKDKWKNDPYF